MLNAENKRSRVCGPPKSATGVYRPNQYDMRATRERGTEAELTQVAPYWFWLQQRNQKPSQFFFVHDSNFRFDFINKNDFSRFLADF
jgi:hypothetical protein